MRFTNRDGELRLYDGSTPPWYLAVAFMAGDFRAPLGPPRPEEEPVVDRFRLTAGSVYTAGSEEAHLAALEMGFSINLTDQEDLGRLLDWLSGVQVNGKTILTTKASSARGGLTAPALADAAKKCADVEYRLDGPTGDLVWRFGEVYFPLDRAELIEADEGVRLGLTGLVYGAVGRASAFTSGLEVTS